MCSGRSLGVAQDRVKVYQGHMYQYTNPNPHHERRAEPAMKGQARNLPYRRPWFRGNGAAAPIAAAIRPRDAVAIERSNSLAVQRSYASKCAAAMSFCRNTTSSGTAQKKKPRRRGDGQRGLTLCGV